MGQTEGLVKLIVDAESEQILGGHILGPHADILIHQIVTAMYQNGTAESIAKSIHVHPTLSEVIKSAARATR
jgi:dihydrolipoamide dehydrogenase